MIRRDLSVVLAVVGALFVVAPNASAQSKVVTLPPNPSRIQTTNTVIIGGTFSSTSGPLVQNSVQGNPCNPGACYDQTTTVRANQRWQLRVTLSSKPADFIVAWIDKSSNVARPITAGAYQVVATGTTATPAKAVPLTFNARKTTGNTTVIVSQTALAALLSYSVIALP